MRRIPLAAHQLDAVLNVILLPGRNQFEAHDVSDSDLIHIDFFSDVLEHDVAVCENSGRNTFTRFFFDDHQIADMEFAHKPRRLLNGGVSVNEDPLTVAEFPDRHFLPPQFSLTVDFILSPFDRPFLIYVNVTGVEIWERLFVAVPVAPAVQAFQYGRQLSLTAC